MCYTIRSNTLIRFIDTLTDLYMAMFNVIYVTYVVMKLFLFFIFLH